MNSACKIVADALGGTMSEAVELDGENTPAAGSIIVSSDPDNLSYAPAGMSGNHTETATALAMYFGHSLQDVRDNVVTIKNKLLGRYGDTYGYCVTNISFGTPSPSGTSAQGGPFCVLFQITMQRNLVID